MPKGGRAISPSRGLAEDGTMVLLALVAGRTEYWLHAGCGNWGREGGGADPDIPPPERSSRRMGRCAGARAPELDAVQVQPLPIHLPPPEVSASEGTRLYPRRGRPVLRFVSHRYLVLSRPKRVLAGAGAA